MLWFSYVPIKWVSSCPTPASPTPTLNFYKNPCLFGFCCFWSFLVHLRFSHNHPLSCVTKVKCILKYKNKSQTNFRVFHPQREVCPSWRVGPELAVVSLACCCTQVSPRRDGTHRGKGWWSQARAWQSSWRAWKMGPGLWPNKDRQELFHSWRAGEWGESGHRLGGTRNKSGGSSLHLRHLSSPTRADSHQLRHGIHCPLQPREESVTSQKRMKSLI